MSTKILPTEVVRLYRIWNSIMYRCHKPENKQYKNYGGRGIFVSESWKDFNNFCSDVGQRPDNTCHLDRIDNDKGYFKENCRWASPKTNHRNKRNNSYIETHLGKVCKSELLETIGYTRKQLERCVEKHGLTGFLEMYKAGCLPKKKPIANLQDLIGKKIAKLTVLRLDQDKSTGINYFCMCDCGKKTRVSRFKLYNNLAKHCISCARKGDLNPNSIKRRT